MKKLILTGLAILSLAGCSHLGLEKPNCYERVAISKISLGEAYKGAATLSDAEKISIEKAEAALLALDHADSLTDSASALCAIDEPTAVDYLNTAGNLLDDVIAIMEGEESNE